MTLTKADVIVLAGDIGNKMRGLLFAFRTSTEHHKPVIYVVGNHEYYGSIFERYIYKLRAKHAQLTAEMKTKNVYAEVYLLDNDEVIIRRHRFLGLTLWASYALGLPRGNQGSLEPSLSSSSSSSSSSELDKKQEKKCELSSSELAHNIQMGNRYRLARQGHPTGGTLTDYKKIKMMLHTGKGPAVAKISPGKITDRHAEHVAWLTAKLQIPPCSSAFDDTIVVSHHAPHPRCIAPDNRGDIFNFVDATDLSHLMMGACCPQTPLQQRSSISSTSYSSSYSSTGTVSGVMGAAPPIYPPVLWICGHTHYCCDFVIGSTRIISNAKGYPQHKSLGGAYNPALVIELKSKDSFKSRPSDIVVISDDEE